MVVETINVVAFALASLAGTFLQHLRVLEDSGLVQSKKSGRVRTFEISPKPLAEAESWLGHQRAIWEGRLDRIEKLIAKMKAAEDKNG